MCGLRYASGAHPHLPQPHDLLRVGRVLAVDCIGLPVIDVNLGNSADHDLRGLFFQTAVLSRERGLFFHKRSPNHQLIQSAKSRRYR
jgi:hypothetical protein